MADEVNGPARLAAVQKAVHAAFAPILAEKPTALVLAVSGGSDSMSLAHLVAGFRRDNAFPPVHVATVDHRLRPGSADDATFVMDQAERLGLPCHRLEWHGAKPARAVQEKARDARYGLLTGLCKQLGATHLVTAHTLDDHAETLLFRMARGSALAGMAGIAARTLRDGVVVMRPLLQLPKAELAAACVAGGWDFVEDPSNANPQYTRTRLRALMPLLAAEGLDAGRFARFAQRADRTEQTLRTLAERIAEATALPSGQAMQCFDGRRLAIEPFEIVLRVLGTAATDCGGCRLRHDRLESLTTELLGAVASQRPLRRTLAGCLVCLDRNGQLSVRPEPERRRGRNEHSSVHAVSKPGVGDPTQREGSLGNGSRDAYIEA